MSDPVRPVSFPPSSLAPPRVERPGSNRLSMSELLAALSRALDLTEGQPMGHTVRTCAIGMRISDELQLSDKEREALYYALLLKDAGCSSNAAHMAAIFGTDDRVAKPSMKEVDWHRRLRTAVRTWRNVGMGMPVIQRLRQLVRLGTSGNVTRDLIQLRCERGAQIARGLGFSDATAQAIKSLDEHWCGVGYPEGLVGEEIPLLSRIANLAQTVEAFHSQHGLDAALRVARERRGNWYDPRLVDLVCGWKDDDAWWRQLAAPGLERRMGPGARTAQLREVDETGLDLVAASFAEIIDAKSPYTFRHSANVAIYAEAIARQMGMDAAGCTRIRRAGLLHDVGKLGVSNRILDKPGALDADERLEVERHPVYTWEILSRVAAFREFAWVAATHHEKLDGSGYPWGLNKRYLDSPMRLLAVADMYEALTADRPYRAGMPPGAALAILNRGRGTKLDPDSIAALEMWLATRPANDICVAATSEP